MAGNCAVFCQAYGAGQTLLLFYVCSFVGWCWEVALHRTQTGEWINRGFLAGPILPIYGFGALLILFVGLPLACYPLRCALAGGVAATLLEYGTGAMMEAVFHVRYWDYSTARWNLNGHISLMSSAIWAGASALLCCVCHPVLCMVLTRVPDGLAVACGGVLTAFALLDGALAMHRAWELRALLKQGADYTAGRTVQVKRLLRRNPGAVSRRYAQPLAVLRSEMGKTV